ncbi:MAG TPA: ribonuclease P protein component [Anditalea sp.]|nr:ribonuclease P protein component [Anditalea sp.]
MNYKLPKNERLHSKKSIKELFDKGSSFFLYPFKVLVLESDLVETNQVLFSVSKKKIRKAVNRNFVKRRIKEAYRLNKHLLEVPLYKKKLIALIYVSSELDSFQKIQPRVQKVLKKIAQSENT